MIFTRHISRVVVGISGASCSGKTTITKLLKATFPWASTVHQDGYYHPNDPKYHVYLPDIKHFDWEAKTALDFPKMERDIHKLLVDDIHGHPVINEKLLCFPNDQFVEKHRPQEQEVNFLISRFSRIPLTILEGHILYSHSPFYNLCNQRYFLTLDQEELFERRRKRVYDPPNPPGYLEKYVWPAYVSRLEEVQKLSGIQYFDAKSIPLLEIFQKMKQSITLEMAAMISPKPKVEDSGTEDMKVNRRG